MILKAVEDSSGAEENQMELKYGSDGETKYQSCDQQEGDTSSLCEPTACDIRMRPNKIIDGANNI